MSKYTEMEDGWHEIPRRGYKMMCCDCGLVHSIDFRIRGRKLETKVDRDNRATGQARRWMKKSK